VLFITHTARRDREGGEKEEEEEEEEEEEGSLCLFSVCIKYSKSFYSSSLVHSFMGTATFVGVLCFGCW
jgi:hypothetical protein